MEYKKLPFNQYFINTSQDTHKTGKATYKVEYNHTKYKYKMLKLFKVDVSAEWDVHYEEFRNAIQINFQATMDKGDWLTNFLFATKVYDEFTYEGEAIQLKACFGWKDMFFHVKHEVRAALKKLLEEHPDAEIEVVGWSLGSALAQYCAQDIFFNFNKQVRLFTYGSVKPWRKPLNKKKAKALKSYLSKCTKECHNFMHRRDVVSLAPPFCGYFAMRPVKLGKFNFFSLFNPNKWHKVYDERDLYR